MIADNDPITPDFNIATDVNTYISSFSAANKKIMFKAFLSSNGTQLVQLNEISIGWGKGGSGAGSCGGTPTACNTYTDQTSCQTQGGCSWSGGGSSCQNVGSCSVAPSNQCNNCSVAGCSKQGKNCIGTLNCSAYTSQASCQTCGQCAWVGGVGSCGGTPTSCSSYANQTSCQNQSGCSWISGGPSYPTSNPFVNPISYYTAPGLEYWTSFTEVASKNGGEIYYQLSDGGASWYYWDGSGWSVAGASNYNTAAQVNSNILAFPTTTAQIMFKAFLSSDGSQLVQLDEVTIGFGEIIGAASYATSGWLESSAFNTGGPSAFNILSWTEVIPDSDFDIKVQLATAPDNSGSPGIWSDWLGLNGVGTYYESGEETLIPSSNGHNDSQWVKYKVFLSGNGNETPILEEIKINYLP